MAKERDDNAPEEGELVEKKSKHRHGNTSKRDQFSSEGESSDSDDGKDRRRKKRSSSKRRSRKRRRRSSSDSDEYDSSSESSYSDSGSVESSESDGSVSGSEQDGDQVKRRKKKERRRKRGKEEERERRMKKKEKEKEKRRKEKKRKEKKKKEKKKKEKDTGKTGAVTNSWGKYGVIRETDMWNKRPEFTAWLAEVKQVNMESLANWEEKQMFREFMEDHNTATFPSTKYYNLDAYQQKQRIKEMKKYLKNAPEIERTVFNDEELRRQELMRERERQKEEQVETLKRSMQSGMAQAMKEQAQLREEMAYQYKLGNFEAAAAIQRRLDPDVAM